jgi:hypothetical protein
MGMEGDEQQTALLAAILCLYAVSEFLLARVLRDPGRGSTSATLIQNGLTLFVVCAGTAGFASWSLAGAFMVALAIRTAAEIALVKWGRGPSLPQFALLQVVSFAGLFAAWYSARPIEVHPWYVGLEHQLLPWIGGLTPRGNSARLFLTLAAYCFMFDGGARIVRGVLDQFPVMMERIAATAAGNESGGEWIGVLERIITLTFVLTGNYTAVAFALTAKSIARFKELDDRTFAEYYLLGTSTSLAVALITGALVRLSY